MLLPTHTPTEHHSKTGFTGSSKSFQDNHHALSGNVGVNACAKLPNGTTPYFETAYDFHSIVVVVVVEAGKAANSVHPIVVMPLAEDSVNAKCL